MDSFEISLVNAGKALLPLPHSPNQTSSTFKQLERRLQRVQRMPSESTKYAMQPVIEALIDKQLIKHPDMDVNISVACCITEVFRIMVYKTPYTNEQMKDFFELVVLTLEKLSSASCGLYNRMIKVLRILGKGKLALMMCDLQLDGLIVRLFKQFLTVADSNSPGVVKKMKQIIVMIIEKTELLNRELVDLLVTSVRKENKIASPVCWQLGIEVLKRCATQLKPHLPKKVAEEVYSPLMETILSTTDTSKLGNDATCKRKLECLDGSRNMVQPVRRCRNVRKRKKKRISTADPPVPTKSVTEAQSAEHVENLVGKRIIVWWPADKKYYQGVVKSFNFDKRHKVLYDDGEKELLDLKQEQWELVETASKLSTFEIKLINAGKGLLSLPASTAELINILEQMRKLLHRVQLHKGKEMLSESMKYAMRPIIEALVAKELLRHSDMNVNISVACCICDVLKIMDYNASYNEEQMKDFFELAVITFEKLSSDGCSTKLFKVLITLSHLPYSLLKSDLLLKGLIVRLFKQFLTSADSSSHCAVSKMKQIMIIIIEQSELLDLELVDLLVTSVKKENQITSPVSWKLGDEVLKKCAAKLKPHLPDQVFNDNGDESHLELVENISSSLDPVGPALPGCDIICIQGYNVKQEISPILESIFKKHGDIAAGCFFKTSSVRTSFLELICEVVKRIESSDVSTINSDMEDIERQVSDAQAANINVSWLKTHLQTIRKKNEAMKISTLLNTILVKRAAEIDLIESRRELVAAQERFNNAERCVKVLDLVERNIKESMKQPLIG